MTFNFSEKYGVVDFFPEVIVSVLSMNFFLIIQTSEEVYAHFVDMSC